MKRTIRPQTLLMTMQDPRMAALERLIIDYQPRLSAYLRRFISDSKVVEDIVQDSFVSFWKKYPSCSSDEFPKIIYTILRHKCLDYLKHQRVRDRIMSDGGYQEGEALYGFDFGERADSQCLLDELNMQISSVLSSLPPKCRKVFEMSRFQEKKNDEIASVLGISVSTVEKHISKALAAFRKSITEGTALELILIIISFHVFHN